MTNTRKRTSLLGAAASAAAEAVNEALVAAHARSLAAVAPGPAVTSVPARSGRAAKPATGPLL
ncbi:MAG TPA: PLP-dependent aminotransferase family protein, partial [Duganella sp.]